MTRYSSSLLFILALLFLPAVTKAQSQSLYSLGESQLCRLQNSGAVNCIVSAGFERLLPPDNLPELIAVSTGDTHACGIAFDGDAICWGDNNFGQLNTPTILLPLTQINAGQNHTCALDVDGGVHCWGLNNNRQTEPPEGAVFTKVHAAFTSSCGILDNGNITCWSSDTGRAPADLTGPFTDLDMQNQGVCGLTVTGEILCNSSINALVPPLNDGPYIDLVTTFGVVCGLNSNNMLDCNAGSDTPWEIPDVADFPLGEQFLSIQSVETGISGFRHVRDSGFTGTTLCGERFDHTLQCWSLSVNFPEIDSPNTTSPELAVNMRLDMDARVYGSAIVEIFWTPVPLAGSTVEVQVFRNGELLERVDARQSYFDGDALPNNIYQLRLIDNMGNTGPLSAELHVDTATRSILFNGESPLLDSRHDAFDLEQVFTGLNSTAVARGSLVYWSISQDHQSSIDGFEIELNGQRAGFTRSQLYLNLEERVGSCISIGAIGFDGDVLDRISSGPDCD